MLNRVCCIIDVDGFSIRNYDEYKQYTNEFLVRELGYIRIDPDYQYISKSYRFDLGPKVNLSRLLPEDKKTIIYQSQRIIGLKILPGQDEDTMEYNRLEEVIRTIYELCRRTNAEIVAYKGGDKEKKLLETMNIPCIDLQGFGCPSYEYLVETKNVYSKIQDCGHHTELQGKSLVHCPKAEVTAYRDWYMVNYKKFRICVMQRYYVGGSTARAGCVRVHSHTQYLGRSVGNGGTFIHSFMKSYCYR